MAKSHGKLQYLKLATTVVSGQMNTFDVDLGGTASDSTGSGAEAEESIPGIGTGAISCSGFYDSTDAAAILAMDNTIVAFEYGPAGHDTGDVKLSGNCLVTSVKVGGGIRDTLGLSISATRTGEHVVGAFA